MPGRKTKALIATLTACGALAGAAPASASITIGPSLEGLTPSRVGSGS